MKTLREKLGLTQTQFWSKIGVTQSAGSRYENERSIPKPVAMLVELVYGKKGVAYLEKLRK